MNLTQACVLIHYRMLDFFSLDEYNTFGLFCLLENEVHIGHSE